MGLNQISGRIPETIGNLFGLASLLMDENALEGPIPNSIGKLKNLVIIFLSMNNLSGNIPTVIGNLTILSVVHMDFNAFKGSIPFTFRYCKKMHTFSVSVNNLSGNIPTQIFAYQKDLVNLDLSTNSFTGERKIMQKQSTKECLVSFARIGVACSQEFPTRRMNIKDIIVELHAIKHKLLP
ncbi:hypothetical protein Ahy_A07g031921 [Arachis hypogaea]|uniref:LRR receptor-like serine/threonine-protein kinase n=1 Tax=Arachis hypogaea TaxID=3818 RepID=A0A445C5I0_ARAHY|nr:hypothetical protein Ahy_A07g031921 [Arachis hypogaea]